MIIDDPIIILQHRIFQTLEYPELYQFHRSRFHLNAFDPRKKLFGHCDHFSIWQTGNAIRSGGVQVALFWFLNEYTLLACRNDRKIFVYTLVQEGSKSSKFDRGNLVEEIPHKKTVQSLNLVGIYLSKSKTVNQIYELKFQDLKLRVHNMNRIQVRIPEIVRK